MSALHPIVVISVRQGSRPARPVELHILRPERNGRPNVAKPGVRDRLWRGLLSGVSWSILATPLHSVDREVLEWASSAGFSYGVPDILPLRQPLPRVAEILTAFRKAGCSGAALFRAAGLGEGYQLASGGGMDLGEVTLQAENPFNESDPLGPDSAILTIGFRHPQGTAALYALSAVAQIAGPMLVFDTDCERVVVVWPADSPVQLADEWPW